MARSHGVEARRLLRHGSLPRSGRPHTRRTEDMTRTTAAAAAPQLMNKPKQFMKKPKQLMKRPKQLKKSSRDGSGRVAATGLAAMGLAATGLAATGLAATGLKKEREKPG